MKRWLACFAAVLPIAPCAAHDVWLSSQPVMPAPGEPVLLQLMLGGDGDLESMPLDPARIERFWTTSAEGVSPIALSAVVAAARLETAPSGTTSIGYVSTPALSELPPDDFAAYLREEHLDRALARWQQAAAERATPAPAVREHFSRSLKALVGSGDAALVDCPLGLPLELSLKPAAAAELLVRATFEGEATPGLWVELADAQGTLLAAKATDDAGQARFARPRGSAVLRATHILPATGGGVAWRSWWASTAFTATAAGIAACKDAQAGRAHSESP